jgi:hypothetical protein
VEQQHDAVNQNKYEGKHTMLKLIKEMLEMLTYIYEEVRPEISRVNMTAGETIFNPTATGTIDMAWELITKVKEKLSSLGESTTFTVQQLIRWTTDINGYEFCELIYGRDRKLYGEDNYVEGKFKQMQKSPISWMANLDPMNKEKLARSIVSHSDEEGNIREDSPISWGKSHARKVKQLEAEEERITYCSECETDSIFKINEDQDPLLVDGARLRECIKCGRYEDVTAVS